jgi:hypothetical protein
MAKGTILSPSCLRLVSILAYQQPAYLVFPLQFPLRKITCWTLGRYSSFIATSDELFPPVLQRLLERLVDGNKVVQRAACVSLTRLFDQGAPRLEGFATPILQTLLVALDRYQVCRY